MESWEGKPEEESLQTSPEHRHRGCGRDMLGQTVQSMGSSDREGPIADGRKPRMTDSQQQ